MSLLLTVIATGTLAACGGGSPEKDFVAEVNSICAEFESFSSDQEDLFREQVSSGEFEEAASTFQEYGRELETSVTEISSLERPEGERTSIDRFIASTRELTDLVPGVVEALREGDTATLISVATRLQEVQKKADREAREAGLDECAEAGPATGTT